MNLVKSYDFFNAEMVPERIHIIGCGSVGSTIAELLARFGITKMTLYDFDVVEEKNIVNQMFDTRHIGMPKVDALASIISDINPAVGSELRLEPKGYVGQGMSGYVFLAPDSIDVRKDIVKKFRGNPSIRAMFDFRTGLTDAQHYAADWFDPKSVENLLGTMDFTHEEAAAATPASACGVIPGVAPTVRMICNVGVANFLNFVRTDRKELRKMILVDAFGFTVDAF